MSRRGRLVVAGAPSSCPTRLPAHFASSAGLEMTGRPANTGNQHTNSKGARNREQHLNTHTHPFNGPLSGTTQVSRYEKGKPDMDFTEARDSEWHWHQLGHIQLCTSLQTDNHASTPSLSFLQAGCPSCRPTNSVKALKASSEQHLKGTANPAGLFHSSAI